MSYVQGRRDERNGVALSTAFGLDGDQRVVSLFYSGIIRAGTWQETPEQQFKNFALSKERASLFDDTTASDVRYTLVLILQTCILSGFCVYDYFSDHDLLLFRTVPHYLLLSIYIGYIVFLCHQMDSL